MLEEELDTLERDGIIEKVSNSEWGTPLVVVPKEDGKLRLCGDYNETLNKSLENIHYPKPVVDDLLAKLHKGEQFSKIHLYT